jgi:hypothetical protein
LEMLNVGIRSQVSRIDQSGSAMFGSSDYAGQERC